MRREELVSCLKQIAEWDRMDFEEDFAYVNGVAEEAACVIEDLQSSFEQVGDKYLKAVDAMKELQKELAAAKVEANNYRKALEALDGVKR